MVGDQSVDDEIELADVFFREATAVNLPCRAADFKVTQYSPPKFATT